MSSLLLKRALILYFVWAEWLSSLYKQPRDKIIPLWLLFVLAWFKCWLYNKAKEHQSKFQNSQAVHFPFATSPFFFFLLSWFCPNICNLGGDNTALVNPPDRYYLIYSLTKFLWALHIKEKSFFRLTSKAAQHTQKDVTSAIDIGTQLSAFGGLFLFPKDPWF